MLAAAARIPAHVPENLVFDFDIYADPRITEDVLGSYADALKDAPDIFYTPANGGHWMIRRYEAITSIVRDPEHFSVREMQIPRVENPPFFIPLSLDPPANLPYRQALQPLFSPKAVQQLEQQIRHWAVKLIEAVADQGHCDFIDDISSQFPVSIFMEMMGMPMERLREFRTLADDFFKSRTPAEYEKYGGMILQIMSELIEDRRANPRDDLITHLLKVETEGRLFTTDEVQAMCYILFLGGMDTVTNVTGFTYQYLAQEPELQTRLREHPELIPNFVDEGLRCFGVVSSPRLVVRDCERFGVQFREGEMVLCSLVMGGRDDRVNMDPNRFDIDRPKSTHLTFSTGPHLCLGHLLARSEMRILTEEWVKRIPSFKATPGRRHGFRIGTVHAIESLPLEWGLAKA